ncbi:MAG: hypothetical protein LLF83_09755 [Methanobacterium sp.]|nr:hypothetical protein [Methanobacterium sp.]
MRKDGPPKLGKSDSRRSKSINLDDIKDKAISIKDKTKEKTNVKSRDKTRNKSDDSLRKETPPKLGKPTQTNSLKLYFQKLKNIPIIKDIKLNRKLILVLAIIVLVVAVGVFAANQSPPTTNKTNNTTNTTPVVSENHFDNGIVSFDYPEGWKVTNGTKNPVIVTVSKDENNSFSVMNENLKNTTFAERVLVWRQNILQSGSITYENNITMDNISGYNIEATYKVNNTIYNTRGIAISKNNTAYFVIFIFNNSLLDYKNEMDLVINSFHVIH